METKLLHDWSTVHILRHESYMCFLNFFFSYRVSEIIPWLYLPTRSIGEYNVTLFIASFNESHTGMLFPVSHGLLEHGSLAAWKNCMSLMSTWRCWLLHAKPGRAGQKMPLLSSAKKDQFTAPQWVTVKNRHSLYNQQVKVHYLYKYVCTRRYKGSIHSSCHMKRSKSPDFNGHIWKLV